MKINPVSSSINFHKGQDVQLSRTIHKTGCDSFEKELKNFIVLKPDVEFDVGTINGKPIKVTFESKGGYVWWNGNPGLWGIPETKTRVTEEEKLSAQALDAYTPEEHEEVGKILGIIIDSYRELKRQEDSKHFSNSKIFEKTKEALYHLGLDPDKPFTINGQTFILNDGKPEIIKSNSIEEDLTPIKNKAIETTSSNLKRAVSRYTESSHVEKEDLLKLVWDYYLGTERKRSEKEEKLIEEIQQQLGNKRINDYA